MRRRLGSGSGAGSGTTSRVAAACSLSGRISSSAFSSTQRRRPALDEQDEAHDFLANMAAEALNTLGTRSDTDDVAGPGKQQVLE